MTPLRRLVTLAALAGAFSIPSIALGAPDKTASQIDKLPWSAGSHTLGQSHGSFLVPKDGSMVQDADAVKVDNFINGTSDSSSEGIIRLPAHHALLYLEYVDSGYVTLDDWKDLDAGKMLSDMKKQDEDSNEERRKNGAEGIHVDGWIKPPTLDRANNSVEYIVKLHDDSSHTFMNAVALALGRKGYERFTLAAHADDPDGKIVLLNSLVHDYTFQKGFRFQDYVQGDKLAGFGVAALVGTAAGVGIAKTVGFGALLLIIKKFFIVIIAAVVAGFRWLKGKFTGGGPRGGASSTDAPKWQA